ncbi:CaiB/BaiF CoA transferase family protein [Nonomuraea lactucae]|uniref:CaiB/BaiF CoA transferase family protein n=1 Tax=Nonomuraea lactucae TaxID=2249762 RepID=UPI000DE27D44|nr:CoA transferase [Nonomuraea lactucae]
MQKADVLAGIRVLDLTNVLAGPFASYQLALLGADVVKVEVPGTGDLARQLGADPELNSRLLGASFLAQNGGKRSVTLDLKSEGGKQAFERLVPSADVVLENFRPGVLERLGFGWPRLRELNPGLVYCAISGFGRTGPMRDRPAYDQVIQGLSGMMAITGTPETAPLRAGYPIADTLGGLAAAFAVSAALVRRQRTGQGAFLDVSMLDSAVTALGWAISNYLIAGRAPEPLGNENMTAAPSGTFRTGTGALNIAANKQEQYEALCRLLGREDLVTDARFADRERRKAHREELTAELEKALLTRPAAEWERLLSAAGVPAARVLAVPEVVALDQLAPLLHRVPFPGSADRRIQVLGNGVRVDGRPSAPSTAAPLLGEHTAEVLREAGYSDQEIDRLRAAGAA